MGKVTAAIFVSKWLMVGVHRETILLFSSLYLLLEDYVTICEYVSSQ